MFIYLFQIFLNNESETDSTCFEWGKLMSIYLFQIFLNNESGTDSTCFEWGK